MKIKILNKNNLIDKNKIISEKYDLSNLKEYETVDGEVYRKNFNETLDSATILIDNLTEKLDIEPYDEVIFDDNYSGKVVSPFTNKTHRMLVDDFRETMVSVYPKIYKYEISLFSKTKLLEGAICPNLSITPLRVGTKRSIYFYINEYMNLYCPKKRVKNGSDYIVEPIISISQNIATKFSDDCPELQWNTPTLREVLNDLFILKDCVPIVNANNELDFLDLTKTNNDISELNTINYIERSQSSKDYVSEIYMNMVNVMNTSVSNVRNTANTSEFIPFNATDYVATTENIILKTKFPIQRIKHLYMVFVGMACGENPTPTSQTCYPFPIIQKVDLTDLDYLRSDLLIGGTNTIENGNFVKEKKEYDNLKVAYRINDMVENFSDYQNCCLYYTRYGNEIRGFGNTTKGTPLLYFDHSVSSTISILNTLSKYSAYLSTLLKGEVGLDSFYQGLPLDFFSQKIGEGETSSPYYSMFFQIDYETTVESVFKASKTNQPSNSRTIIDNQSYSFVDAYSQGFLEYQKANRLGNQVLMINQRLDTSTNGTLIDIGDYYIENGEKFIVYSVEYQNHKHYIEVNAQATKDYILRNYFTGVKQKIRTWINAQDEAHIRSEITKSYIEISETNKGNEAKKFTWGTFFSYPLLMSGVLPVSQKSNAKPNNAIIRTKTVNNTYLPSAEEGYYTDTAFRVIGKSIVLTTGFTDNYIVDKRVNLGGLYKNLQYGGNIQFNMFGGGVDYPSIYSAKKEFTDANGVSQELDVGGIPLTNSSYTDNNGEIQSSYIAIGREISTPTNTTSNITNAWISSVSNGRGYITFDSNLFDNDDTAIGYTLTKANQGKAFCYIDDYAYTIKLDSGNPYIEVGENLLNKRATVLPVKISSSNFWNTDVYNKVSDFMLKCYNFPILKRTDYSPFASITTNIHKDNKEIYRHNIQLEYISDSDNIYFTKYLLTNNNMISDIINQNVYVYYSNNYIKDSEDLPSGSVRAPNANISISDNNITISKVPPNMVYYITNEEGKIILGTKKKSFYVNIKGLLNDNIYNDNGIIIDKL